MTAGYKTGGEELLQLVNEFVRFIPSEPEADALDLGALGVILGDPLVSLGALAVSLDREH
jgi:hypothetical protein